MATLDMLEAGLTAKLNALTAGVAAGTEMEVGFAPLSMRKFHDMIANFGFLSEAKGYAVEQSAQMDVTYRYREDTSVYRVTVDGIENINDVFTAPNMVDRKMEPHVVIGMLAGMLSGKAEQKFITGMNKVKPVDRRVVVDEYDLIFRVADELPLKEEDLAAMANIGSGDKHHVSFRFKQRVSLLLEDNPEVTIRIDLTDAKTKHTFYDIHEAQSRYELELDVTFKKEAKASKYYALMADNLVRLLKFLQSSNILIKKSERAAVLDDLARMAYRPTEAEGAAPAAKEKQDRQDLPIMQAFSAGIQEIIDTIPANYAVTDKADGEHYMLFVHNAKLYLISNNLEVRLMGDANPKYNHTLLDGEMVFIEKYGKFLFLAFDVLFFCKTDMRPTASFKARLKEMTKAINGMFDAKYQPTPPDLGEGYTAAKATAALDKHITAHYKNLDEMLAARSVMPLVVSGKLFMFPNGLYGGEIYSYAHRLYTRCTDGSLPIPYTLDGLIFTPMQQPYTHQVKDMRFKIYKWKPSHMNSVDFYVEYERDRLTDRPVIAFDNTATGEETLDDFFSSVDLGDVTLEDLRAKSVGSRPYMIINLMVGKSYGAAEKPVPFMKDEGLHKAYVFVDEQGMPRDAEGNIIEDKTVVEFSFDLDKPYDAPLKWVPLRTRYDKTDMVVRFARKYGNNENVAKNVWQTIKQNVTTEDLAKLGDEKHGEAFFAELKKRLDKLKEDTVAGQLIKVSKGYYAVSTENATSLRDFHNWIKSNMIYTYCNQKPLPNGRTRQLNILDVGFGVGGDIEKYYHARAKHVVGLEPDYSNLFKVNGAFDRYEKRRKAYPNFTPMTFVLGTGGARFNKEDQRKALGAQIKKTEADTERIFGANVASKKHQTFDAFVCMFMLHYLFESQEMVLNFCANVNKYLEVGGYLLITTFDAQALEKSWGQDGSIRATHTDEEGKQRLLFDIKRKYGGGAKEGTKRFGLPIDVYNSIYQVDDTFYTEYVVDKDLLTEMLAKHAGMRLVDTAMFETLFNLHKPYFLDAASKEDDPETLKFLSRTKKFIEQSDPLDRKWFEFSRLSRFYVFQKMK